MPVMFTHTYLRHFYRWKPLGSTFSQDQEVKTISVHA